MVVSNFKDWNVNYVLSKQSALNHETCFPFMSSN